jgi:Cu/Ag efflux pump CusA
MIALLLQVVVLTQAPGMTAPEVEAKVTLPLEQALGGLGAVESRSAMGFSELRVKTDSRAEVVERLQRAVLPTGVAPSLAPAALSKSAWMRYTVASDRFSSIEVRTLQDWQLRRSFLMIPGVADVATCGGRVERLEVDVDAARMAAYKLRLGDIVSAVSANHVGAHDLRDLEEIVLEGNKGVRLRDVGRVQQSGAPPRCLAFLDGMEVVVGVVQPRVGGPVDLAAKVRAKMATAPLGMTVQPFAPTQEITLNSVVPLKLEEAVRLAHAVDQAVRAVPGVEHALVEVGALDDFEESFREVRVLLRGGADISKALALLPMVVRVGEGTAVRISGPDLAVLEDLAAKAGQRIERMPQLSVEPDRTALARMGLNVSDLMMYVQAACAGVSAGTLWRAERRIEIAVRLPDACASLATLRIGTVPLSNVARLRRDALPAEIRRAGGVRFVELRAHDKAEVARIRAIPLPAGYTLVIP